MARRVVVFRHAARAAVCIAIGVFTTGCAFDLADVKDGPRDAGAPMDGAGGTTSTDAEWNAVSEAHAPDGDGASVSLTIPAVSGLGGDGFLARPSLCDEEVLDYSTHPTYRGIQVGRDLPCGTATTYRAFVRFSITVIAGVTPIAAKLRLFLFEKKSPTAGVDLFEIADFGALTASGWDAQEMTGYGQFFGAGVAQGWVETDVTPSLVLAVAGGATAVAFKLQYGDESEDPNGAARWYGIQAADDGPAHKPQLVVTYH